MSVSISSTLFSQNKNEQTVRKAFETFETIMRDNDAKAAAPLLTDNFMLNAVGLAMNKEQRLASIKAGQFKYNPFKEEDTRIDIDAGETSAVVTVKTTVKYKSRDQDISVDLAFLTFVKKEDQWQLAGECYLGANCFK